MLCVVKNEQCSVDIDHASQNFTDHSRSSIEHSQLNSRAANQPPALRRQPVG